MSLLPRIIKQIKSNMTAINRNNAFQNLYFTHIQYQLALKDLFAITSANYGLCHAQSKQTTIRYVSSTLKFIPKKIRLNNSIHTQSIFGCSGYL